MSNLAFIDGQNLHFGTTKCNNCAERLGIELKNIKFADCTCGSAWEVDLYKFRIYLAENYGISEAYYFLGYLQDENSELYKVIQKAGFIVIFKEHNKLSKSKKKGNIDTDMVFEVMKSLIDHQDFNKIMLISGDGDYKKMIQYLISKSKFLKILFPNKKYASSLYKEFGSELFDYLDNIKSYIGVYEKGS